jgi:hypothetical protein
MRLFLAMVFSIISAPAWALECSTVANPAERLFCYEAQDKASKLPPPKARFDIPVTARRTMPDFNGRDKAFKSFRTRIRAAVEGGPNFAGNMHLFQIGCGTSCTFALAIDLNTGKVYDDIPFGIENPQLQLSFNRTGNMVLTRYLSENFKRCLSTTYTWDGKTFSKVADEIDLGEAGICDQKVTL